jgi:hypothetical protein
VPEYGAVANRFLDDTGGRPSAILAPTMGEHRRPIISSTRPSAAKGTNTAAIPTSAGSTTPTSARTSKVPNPDVVIWALHESDERGCFLTCLAIGSHQERVLGRLLTLVGPGGVGKHAWRLKSPTTCASRSQTECGYSTWHLSRSHLEWLKPWRACCECASSLANQ